MSDLNLTDIVEEVSATAWEQQKGTPWVEQTPMVQHNCREALLPYIGLTIKAIDGHISQMVSEHERMDHALQTIEGLVDLEDHSPGYVDGFISSLREALKSAERVQP